jgi:serine/threonine protein kinase
MAFYGGVSLTLRQGNVLIDDFGVPKLCDFGLARIFLEQGSTGMTTTSEHTGTARYLAPELVASDTPVSPTLARDVYALGCLGLDVGFGPSLPISH